MVSWKTVICEVLKNPAYEDVVVPKNEVPHPLKEGFITIVGVSQGQLGDYEYILPDGRRIYVQEFEDYYKVHWDYVSPRINSIEHLKGNTSHWLILLSFLVAILLGFLGYRILNNNKKLKIIF